MNCKQNLIQALALEPHTAEGGYYRELYRFDHSPTADGRAAVDTIYYMLTDDSPIGHFHQNQSDIVHFFHLGGPLRYTTISPTGSVDTFVMGPHINRGQVLQRVVPGGHWKASELMYGEFGLISEAVVPAFSADRRVIATRATLLGLLRSADEDLLRLAWP